MSTFRDILDTVSGLEGEVVDMISSTRQQKSLSKTSMEGVLNFPVITTNALTIEDASLVNKALEKEFASFTLIAMTMNPYLYTGARNANAATYVNKFHQNVDRKTSGTDIINAVNTFMAEAATKLDVDYEVLEEVSESIIYHVYEGVNHAGINRENLKFDYSITDVTESAILNDIAQYRAMGHYRPTVEANDTLTQSGAGYQFNHSALTVGDNADAIRIGDGDVTINQYGGGGNRHSAGAHAEGRNARQLQHMMDNDAKKANELVPTLLHMRIYPVDKRSDVELPPIDFIVGIKATLHPVSSDEMITNICRGIKNENKIFNFLRWTTGEIKFAKDFVFGMNELKIDALNSSDRASKWWSMLKRRKAMAKIKNIILPNKLLPNATIMVTQEEVDTIKDVYGYDLNQSHIVYKLMSNYFLIAFVIVDPALQRVKFLFDGRNEFETLTYATLAREATTNDRQFKEMLNMLGRRI